MSQTPFGARPRVRRIFVRTEAPARFADELARGCLVVTRLAIPPGDEVRIAVRTPAASRAVEVPARVLGRRAFGPGPVGLRVRALAPAHPALELLRALAEAPAASLERRVQEHAPVRISAGFPSLRDLEGELSRLLRGQVAILPLPAKTGSAPRPGDRLDVLAGAPDPGARLSFDARCRGVARLPDGVRCLVSLVDDEARTRLCASLRALAARAHLDESSAFTAP